MNEVVLAFCSSCGTLVGQTPIDYGSGKCCQNCGNKFTTQHDGFIYGSFFNDAAEDLFKTQK